jgi:hypothetical protein
MQHSAPKQTLAPYNKRIRAAVSPNEPWKQEVRLFEGRKAISEFRKANGNVQDTLALMICYVQCGNDFTLEFGDIDERFYDSMCSMVSQIKDRLLKEQDHELVDEILPLLEKGNHPVCTALRICGKSGLAITRSGFGLIGHYALDHVRLA